MKIKIKVIEENLNSYKISCAGQEIIINKIYIDSEPDILEQLAYISLKHIKNFDKLDILDSFDYEEDIEKILLSSHSCVLNIKAEEVII